MIKTYLKKVVTENFSIYNPQKNWQLNFVNVTNVEYLKKEIIESGGIDYYSIGVVIMNFDGVEINGLKDVDLIVPFWWEFLVAIEDFVNMGEGEFSFPNQGQQIRMERVNQNKIKISKKGSVTKPTVIIDKFKFIQEVKIAGRNFYESIQDYSNINFNDSWTILKELDI